MQENEFYDKQFLIRGFLFLLICCGAMKVSNGAGFAIIFLPLLWAFSKNRMETLLYCILLTAVITVTNSALAPKGPIFGMLNRGVYLLIGFTMLFQNMGRRVSKFLVPVASILLYCAFQALASCRGWAPLISYLKLFLFGIIFLAMFQVANATTNRGEVDLRKIRSVLLIFACFLIFGSIALIPFPSLSKMSVASLLAQGVDISAISFSEQVGLYMGITFQSQTLGPVVSALSAVLLADWLFSIRQMNWFYFVLLICCPILIYMTSSRTAMGTYLAGTFFVLLCFIQSRGVGTKWKIRVLSLMMVGGIVLALVTMATPSVRESALQFVFKTGAGEVTDTSFEKFTSSRQGLIDTSLKNFKDSPAIGNGFQVSEKMKGMKITSYKQLLSAPIEKGVWIYAILEEGGVIGMCLFGLFLLISFWGLLSRHAYLGAAALFVLMISNFGEFSFFSMSSIGGVLWALVFMGLAIDAQRQLYYPSTVGFNNRQW